MLEHHFSIWYLYKIDNVIISTLKMLIRFVSHTSQTSFIDKLKKLRWIFLDFTLRNFVTSLNICKKPIGKSFPARREKCYQLFLTWFRDRPPGIEGWDIFWPKSTPKLTENHQNPWIFMKIGELQTPLIFFVGKTGTSAYKILISTPRDLSIALVKRFTRLAAEYINIYNS